MPDEKDTTQDPQDNPETPETPESEKTTDDGATPPETPPQESTDDTDDGAEPEGGTTQPEEKDSDDSDDSDDLLEEEEKRINKVVQKNLQPIQERYFKQEVDSQVSEILSQNPEYKPYEARIKRWVTHPNRASLIRQGLPVKTVVLESITPYLEKITAERVRKADQKANQTRVDGSSSRPTESGRLPDFSNMNPQEIENIGDLVKRGAYNPK